MEYAERLLSLFPEGLSKVFFVTSGNEANELALRMARAHTGRSDVLVLDRAYHGNTAAMADLSPSQFHRASGEDSKPWVHTVPTPDPYRGRFRAVAEGGVPPEPTDTPSALGLSLPGGKKEPEYLPVEELGARYAEELRGVLRGMRLRTRSPAAFFCESIPGSGGQIILPQGHLAAALSLIHI